MEKFCSVDKSRFVRLVPAQLSTIYGKVLHSWMEATPRDALASFWSELGRKALILYRADKLWRKGCIIPCRKGDPATD